MLFILYFENYSNMHNLASRLAIEPKFTSFFGYFINKTTPMLTVKQLLEGKTRNTTVYSVTPDHMVIDALELMAQKNIGAVVVLDGDSLIGIFSERDYARKGILQGRKAKSTPVTEVMTPNVFTVSPEKTIQDCMNLFSEKHIRHLPVMDGPQVVGVLSISDIVNAIIHEQGSRIQFLEQYISGY